jgi:hypothetical protein
MANMTSLCAVCALVATACGNKKDDGGAAKTGDSGDLPAELAKWMPANAKAVVQGSWQARISFYGEKGVSMDAPAALEITGDTARAWDGQKEHALELAIARPCLLTLREAIANGKASYDKNFLVAGGKLVAVGGGAAGYRKGKEAIVCQIGPDSLITADATGACKSWKQEFMNGKWKATDTPCSWTTKDGKDAFIVGKPDDHWGNTLVADGDLLWTDQLRDEAKSEQYMKRATDYAAAKAWADVESKKK